MSPDLSSKAPRTLHPMASFGSVSGLSENLRVNRLESRMTPLVPFPHKHDFYQILLVKVGSGTHEIDFTRYPVRAGSLFVMRPAEVHSWSMPETNRGIIIEFSINTLESNDLRWQQLRRILDNLPAAPRLDPKTFKRLYDLSEESLREFEATAPNFQLVLLSHLIQFLIVLSRSALDVKVQQESTYELYESFRDELEDHFREQHSVAYYAEALGLTPKALTMRFARQGLKPPRDLIHDRCLLEAKRLLAYSSLTIQEISDRLGFEDPNYFSRLFRKKMATSPGTFRKESGNMC